MTTRASATALLAALALVATACSSGEGSTTFPPESFAIPANADIGVGRSRLLVGIGDPTGRRLGSPENEVVIAVAPADRPDAVQTVPGIFTWIVVDAFGLYRAEFDFDAPGVWQVVVIPEAGDSLPPAAFNVFADTFAPAVGEPAPAPQTPTLDDFSFEEITTDPDPDATFYELSLDQAIGNGRKTVVVFATPAFCVSAACGPLLEIVKEVAPQHPDVDFVHIEVYTNLTDVDFAPIPKNLAPAVLADWWNLPSEPWVFVIDETGIVQARFEGVMAAEELTAEL
ncbi:MAG: hypothetical protein V3V29_04550 [Acidimicrobiia bacterium]